MIGLKVSAVVPTRVNTSAVVPTKVDASANINIHHSNAPAYEGDYDIEPSSDPVVLPTKGYMMKDNLRVRGIGTISYPSLTEKPSIEGNELLGDKSFRQLGLDTATVQEVEAILYLDL